MKRFNQLLKYGILESQFKNRTQMSNKPLNNKSLNNKPLDNKQNNQENTKLEIEKLKKEKIILQTKINELEKQNKSIKLIEISLEKQLKEKIQQHKD